MLAAVVCVWRAFVFLSRALYRGEDPLTLHLREPSCSALPHYLDLKLQVVHVEG